VPVVEVAVAPEVAPVAVPAVVPAVEPRVVECSSCRPRCFHPRRRRNLP
jgi:hypothetical protein